MKVISMIIIFDGINTAFTKHPNGNFHLISTIHLIIGIITICVGVSLLSKRKYSYLSAIITYIIRIIILIYYIFVQFTPMYLIFTMLCLYIGIIIYIKNRKKQFR